MTTTLNDGSNYPPGFNDSMLDENNCRRCGDELPDDYNEHYCGSCCGKLFDEPDNIEFDEN